MDFRYLGKRLVFQCCAFPFLAAWATNASIASITVPVSEGGTPIGTITIDVSGGGVTGNFTGNQNLADLAKKLGEDHFNWFQKAKTKNAFLGVPAGGLFIDPQSGGQGTLWADKQPWYWDETAPPDPLPAPFKSPPTFIPPAGKTELDSQTSGKTLGYSDSPGSSNANVLNFTTILMSIGPGNTYRPLAGFTWTATLGGMGGTVISDLKAGATFTPEFAKEINNSGFGTWTQVPEPFSIIVWAGMSGALIIILVHRRRLGGTAP